MVIETVPQTGAGPASALVTIERLPAAGEQAGERGVRVVAGTDTTDGVRTLDHGPRGLVELLG